MPVFNDGCSPLVGRCVVFPFKDLCLDGDARPPRLNGKLELTNYTGGDLTDPNGVPYYNSQTIETYSNSDKDKGWELCTDNGCEFWGIKTCALPANIDSAYDPTDPTSVSRALNPQGTTYTMTVQVGKNSYVHEFQIDAAFNYDSVELCGCIPITSLLVDTPPPVVVGDDPFVDAVCKAIKTFDLAGTDATTATYLVGADAAGNCLLFTPPGAGVQTTTVKYVTGDTIGYAVTLPDGTVLPVNTPVPDGVCVVAEEDLTGAPVTVQVFVATDSNNTPQIYIEGDTVEQEITLADGTVVPVGGVLPDGICVFLELDADGNIVEQDQITKLDDSCKCSVEYVAYDPAVHVPGVALGDGSAANPFQIALPSIPTVTVKYVEGDILTYDVTLADGTVVVAGTPLPSGTCLVAEENPDGTSSSYNSFVLDDQNNTPEVYLPGDTVDYTVTLLDGTVLNPGDVYPPGSCLFLEIDAAGNIVEQDERVKVAAGGSLEFIYVDQDDAIHVSGSAAEGVGTSGDPIQIPLPPDVKDLFEETPVPCEEAENVIVSTADGCGPVPYKDLIPKPVFDVCTNPGELVQPVFDPDQPLEHDFVATYLGHEQEGDYVFDPGNEGFGGFNTTDFPWTYNVPQASTGCVLFLHLTYGSGVNPFSGVSLTHTGTNLAAPVFVGTQVATTGWSGALNTTIDTVQHSVWMFDVNSTGPGDTVTVDWANFPSLPDNNDGVFSLQWTEVCRSSGPLTVADWDLAAVQNSLAPQPADGPSEGGGNSTSDPWDLGECPAIVFAASRHSATNPLDITAVDNTVQDPDATDWFQPSTGLQELYDQNSYNGYYSCQIGWAAGFADGNLGSWDWTFQGNESTQYFGGAGAMAIPLANCSDIIAAASNSADSLVPCDSEVCNTNKCEGVLECKISGSVTLTVPAGESVTVYPLVNGGAMGDAVAGWDNTNGAAEVVVTLPISSEIVDLSTILQPGDCSNSSFTWRVENVLGTGTALINKFTTTCKVDV